MEISMLGRNQSEETRAVMTGQKLPKIVTM